MSSEAEPSLIIFNSTFSECSKELPSKHTRSERKSLSDHILSAENVALLAMAELQMHLWSTITGAHANRTRLCYGQGATVVEIILVELCHVIVSDIQTSLFKWLFDVEGTSLWVRLSKQGYIFSAYKAYETILQYGLWHILKKNLRKPVHMESCKCSICMV